MDRSDNKETLNTSNSAVNIIKDPGSSYHAKSVKNYSIQDYFALPDNVHAELIDGRLFYMSAPTPEHQGFLFETASALRSYIRRQKGSCKVMIAPLDVQLDCDDKTMVQPDIFVLCSRDKLTSQRIYGAPDLCIEITSPSSRILDMKIKLHKYKNAGVRKYWIADIAHRQTLCYFFEENSIPAIDPFETPVPVHIFNDELYVSFFDIEADASVSHLPSPD